tara:strand:- start:3748 stop:5142 length:1395 start_codon:yes stop_codon:yes gene_type:complete
LLILLSRLFYIGSFCLSLLLFVSFSFCSNLWVAKYGDREWFESDFYAFYPEYEWSVVGDKETKNKILTSFLKQNVAAHMALELGLNYSFDVSKKVFARYKMLLVNEYYMRYFLGTLIPPGSISFCNKHLKTEVYAKHILLPFDDNNLGGSSLGLASSIRDSILMGFSFSDMASKYSVDPSVGINGGALGWVQIGKTDPSFQDALFSLCEGCLGVVETGFGVHIVGVDSIRLSHYNKMDKHTYDDYVFRFASAYIEENLKDVAASHDTLLIKEANIVFDDRALMKIVSLLDEELLKKGGKRRNVDVLGVLKNSQKIIASYNGDFLSGSWFANKIETTLHRAPFYMSLSDIKADFTLILLRDIAYQKAVSLGLENGFSFISQYLPVKLGVYEKAYMTWLVENVSNPTKEEVELYFMENKKEGSLQKQYKSIEAILLQQKQKEVKSLFERSIEKRENIKVNVEWLDG